MDLEETGLKGNPSVAAVVFNRTVKYDGASVRQTVATLTCLVLTTDAVFPHPAAKRAGVETQHRGSPGFYYSN